MESSARKRARLRAASRLVSFHAWQIVKIVRIDRKNPHFGERKRERPDKRVFSIPIYRFTGCTRTDGINAIALLRARSNDVSLFPKKSGYIQRAISLLPA